LREDIRTFVGHPPYGGSHKTNPIAPVFAIAKHAQRLINFERFGIVLGWVHRMLREDRQN